MKKQADVIELLDADGVVLCCIFLRPDETWIHHGPPDFSAAASIRYVGEMMKE